MAPILPIFFLFSGLAAASLQISDPSDIIDSADWEDDNDLYADYDVTVHTSQPSDILAQYEFTENSTSLDHEYFYVDANDTSVILLSDGAELDLSYSVVEKFGYYTNLNDASFWGFNSAVNVANASIATLDHVNITVHNGAANVYSYGSDTVVYVTNSWLYSSGPVSHGVYASGYGTAYISNTQAFSGGMRSSSFSGDSAAGYIYVSDSTGHTTGIGSACFFTLGLIDANNVACLTENAPTVFMDGEQNATLVGVSAQAGLLASAVIFSSADRQSGGLFQLIDSKLESTGDDMPGLWFGNTIVTAYITSSSIVTQSGVLVMANTSQVTQEFDHFAGSEENSSIMPAIVDIYVSESSLEGDLVAYDSNEISWSLGNHSTWVGAAYSAEGDGVFSITLDSTSTWNLTADTDLQIFIDEDDTLSNVYSGGFSITYNASAEDNSWLDGNTIDLVGGGSLTPS